MGFRGVGSESVPMNFPDEPEVLVVVELPNCLSFCIAYNI